jgi:hypothetical protein
VAQEPVVLTAQARDHLVETRIACPFLGGAVHQELLGVRGSGDNPLADMEEVRRLGNTGGGDLGDLLVLFAAGNHAFMRDASGTTLSAPVPAGLFSLELPGSQGSHPGHSGILEGDPTQLGSGRTSQEDFDRLAARAKDGFLQRSDVGCFIAENLKKDPKSKVTGTSVVELLSHDLAAFVEAIGSNLIARFFSSDEDAAQAHRVLEEKLTKLTGEDNLVGSAGEFGLLFAFLARSPETRVIDGEPALSLETVRGMFLRKTFPDGWQSWPKTRAGWVLHTTGLMLSADKEYRRLSAEA